MQTMTLEEFHSACRAQASSVLDIVFICPMCRTPQCARDLIDAGAGADMDAVERYLGFSCVGRFTNARSPRPQPDGKPCDWTLGGLFPVHKFEIITPDGVHHPRFELATREDAQAYLELRVPVPAA